MGDAAKCMTKIKAKLDAMNAAAKQAVDETADDILELSTDTFCPVDKGVLKASAKNEVDKNSSSEYTRNLSYNTPYAIYVHEIPKNHPVGSWKYLSTPLNIKTPELEKNIKNKVKGVLK